MKKLIIFDLDGILLNTMVFSQWDNKWNYSEHYSGK